MNNLIGKSGVYLLLNKINGKIYIGRSVNLCKRIRGEYKYCSPTSYHSNNRIITKAIRKYGWENFEVSILEFDDKNNLTDLEIYWINHYDATNPNIGYNILKFGNESTGYKHSELTKQKISKSNMGKYCGDKNPMFGKSHTALTKQLMSKKAKNRAPTFKNKHHSDEAKKRISLANGKNVKQIDKKTLRVIRIWNSPREAARMLFPHKKTISTAAAIYNACKIVNVDSSRRSSCGFYWEYTDA